MKTVELNLLLMRNLESRMEYNEKQESWKLSGSITKAEHNAFMSTLDVYAAHVQIRTS